MTNPLFSLAFATLPVFGALAIYDDVTTAQYPDADAVVIDTTEKVAYEPDGSYVRISDDWIKVLTEKGRREESEIELHYNARYGTAEILGVWVIGADGAARAVDVSDTMKDATDNSSVAANIYDPQDRRIVCTVPGVKVGEVIHYRTKKVNRTSRVKDQYADLMLLELPAPVLRATVEITAPAARPLAKWAVRNPLGNVTHTERTLADGRILYAWTATNSPQAFPEPDMPPFYTQAQLLRVSTAADWPTLSRWYWGLCTPHLAKTTPAITNKVAEIGRDMERIYRFVAQEIRYMGLTMEDTSPGYAPHDVCITFDNRYGVCRDKAALLVAMLRIAGFEAYPVLIHAGAKMDPEVALPFFNHAICGVRAPGDPRANADGYILMDPTDESSRDLLPSYLSDRSYLVACPQGEKLLTSPVPTAAANAVKVTDAATLDRDGSLLVETTAVFNGINDNIYRGTLLRRKPELRRKLFERLVRTVAPGTELLQFDLSPADLQDTTQALTVKMYVRMPEMVLRGETRDELVVPMFSRVLGAANWLLAGNTSLERRRYPLDLSSTAGVEETLTLKLEGALGEPLALPEAVSIEGPYEFTRTFDVTDGVLTAKRRLAINTVEVAAAAYPELRENIKRVEAAERAKPVFGKDPLADANVRFILQEERYAFVDDYNWCVTNTVVKEILTYDGKKRSSELTYVYNPTWKRIDVVSATVSNRNGRVSVLSDREKNVLDCGWAADAPRYPASKQLVVNLPSVEVGSVITYTTVTTVKDSPKPFYGTWFFDSPEPFDRYVLTGPVAFDGPKKRIRSETMQADGVLWRDVRTCARGDFATAARYLCAAAEVGAAALPDGVARSILQTAKEQTLAEIRNWMAKNVRIAGPGLYDVPLARQLTDPATVLRERYATRLDYVRTLCALLRGAGFEADVVFAAEDADDEPRLSHRNLVTYPNVGMFASALCRVTVREGGFLGWGGRTTTYFLGTENEYTPLGATPFARCHYLDPKTGVIDRVPDGGYLPKDERLIEITLRENGAADVDVTELSYGPGVGGFRRQYAEMLPEDRSRHFQSLLGDLAQAASATRMLETDITGYPAKRTFSAFIPNYATQANGLMSLNVPAIGFLPFNLTDTVRETPLGVGAATAERVTVRITFPPGYAFAEHLPEAYAIVNPLAPSARWYAFDATAETLDAGTDRARVRVELTRETASRPAVMLPRDYTPLLKDWAKTASSRANRTITVRRAQ